MSLNEESQKWRFTKFLSQFTPFYGTLNKFSCIVTFKYANLK